MNYLFNENAVEKTLCMAVAYETKYILHEYMLGFYSDVSVQHWESLSVPVCTPRSRYNAQY